MAFDPQTAMQYGALPGFFPQFFGGGQDPTKGAMEYLHQIPGSIAPYLDPYINAGKGAIGELQGQYSNLLGNPGGMLNQIGQGYQQSPGFKFAMQQALQGAGNAAAAGGMAGSPQHQQQNMQLATDIGNQDYYNWLGKATGMYGMGLQGEQGLYGGGLQAGTSMSDQIAQMLAQKANLSYAGAANKNQGMGSMLGNIGAIASFL